MRDEILPGEVESSALSRARHGSVRTYLNVGRHPIVRYGDLTRRMRTVGVAMFALIFEVLDEIVATKAHVARTGIQLNSIRFGLGLGVRTHLETHKLLVCRHLSAWNECSAAALSRTGDRFVTALGKMAIQYTTCSFPLAFVVYAHNL